MNILVVPCEKWLLDEMEIQRRMSERRDDDECLVGDHTDTYALDEVGVDGLAGLIGFMLVSNMTK